VSHGLLVLAPQRRQDVAGAVQCLARTRDFAVPEDRRGARDEGAPSLMRWEDIYWIIA
jgi:hypothetical protein